MKRVLMLPLFCAVAAFAGCADEHAAAGLPMGVGPAFQSQAVAVPNPVVTGPMPANASPGSPSHDYRFFAAAFDHAAAGYVEEEFFIEGTARRYTLPELATGTMLDDGHEYRTRIVVRRPASASDFNGTVVMEWQNATVGHDLDGLWLAGAAHFMRRGYALVAVSVQWWGVQLPGVGLRGWSTGGGAGTLLRRKHAASAAPAMANTEQQQFARPAARCPAGLRRPTRTHLRPLSHRMSQ